MKAIVLNKYGSIENLALESYELLQLATGQVRVKVHYISLNPRDISIINGKFKIFTGNKFPKLVGADFAGEVLEADSSCKRLKKGDMIFGYFDNMRKGVSAQEIIANENAVALAPSNISLDKAAALGCTYLTAYQALIEKGSLPKYEKVLIYGASGGVGTAATQIAKQAGAFVTAVSHSRHELYCLNNGAHEFIAYDKQNPFEQTKQYDTFFQVFSDKGSMYSVAKKVLRNNGKFISLIPNPLMKLKGFFSQHKLISLLVKNNINHLKLIGEAVKKGDYAPHIDHVYQIEDYKAAFEQMENGTKSGKILIKMTE